MIGDCPYKNVSVRSYFQLIGPPILNTPTSIVAPSVLLEEMELKKPAGNQQRPALLTHPYFTNN